MNLSFKPGDRVFIREAILSRAYNFATMFGWPHDAKAIEALALAQKKRRYFTVLEVDNVKGWVTIDYVEDGKNKVRGTEDLCFYKEQCAELPIEKEEPKTEKRAGLYLL
jgi:hypothetical protein